jgi:hypothetical protein
VSLLPPGSVSAFSMRIRIRNRPPKIIADLDSKHCFHLVTDILQKSNLYPVVINLVSDGSPDTFKTFVGWLAKKWIFLRSSISHTIGLAYGFLSHHSLEWVDGVSLPFYFCLYFQGCAMRIWIRINFGSWIRIRLNVKIAKL